MNRVIKFRGWDGVQMIPDFITVNSDGHFIGHSTGSGVYAPMQFTGLLDRNGKEIYEGDALLWDQNYVFEVVYEVGQFVGKASAKNGVRGNLSFHHFTNSEVIGNIHEHIF